MPLRVCGILILLGLIFAAMIIVGRRWCARDRSALSGEGKNAGPPDGPSS